jgi:hypothetical protein
MKDPWAIREILDGKTGKVERIYTFKRKRCRRVVLDSPLARQLAGYALIEKDLRSVRLWLENIRAMHQRGPKNTNDRFAHSADRKSYTLIKGLFVAALTFYGKCYSRCEGRRVKLERSQLEPRFHVTHDEAIRFRHNFAAHSGAAKLEDVTIALVFPAKAKVRELPRIYRELSQPDLLWSEDSSAEASFVALTEHAHSIVVNKISSLDDKIMKEDVLPRGFGYWRTM